MTELSKQLLSGLSPPISLMLGSLIQDPQFSLDPYFWVVLVGGSVTFAISLYRFLEKKHGWVTGVWNVAGVGLAGFVLVSWAGYDSFLTSIMIEAVVMVAIVIGFLLRRKALVEDYGRRNSRLVYLGLVLGALLPLAVILPHISETPVLKVSPSQYVSVLHGGMTESTNVAIASFYANVWDIRVTTESPKGVAVYLDGTKDGPVEIPFLEHGRKYVGTIRLETSPMIQNGTYYVPLRFQYRDALGHIYQGSEGISVYVGYESPTSSPPISGFTVESVILGVIIALFVLFLRRRRG
jgi:hypothetical protein